MSDIFISYAREDLTVAKSLAEALEARGWSVFWDQSIQSGQHFDDVIEREIGAASCVIVLWSKSSVTSRWVRTEALEGAERDVLIPIMTEEVHVPMAFKRIQTGQLIGWDGRESTAAFRNVLKDIESIAGPPRTAVQRTLLLAGIREGSRQTAEVGDLARTHFAQLLTAFEKIGEGHGGSVVQALRGEIICVFDDPRDAAWAARDMQRHISGIAPVAGVPERAKIGLHSGSVLLRQNHISGAAVHVALRVQTLAAPGQILSTVAAIASVDATDIPVRDLGQHQVRGSREPLQLHELLWRGEVTQLTRVAPRPDARPNFELTCRMGPAKVVMASDRQEPITLGRGSDSTLVVSHDCVSRHHAQIVRRRGLFYLQDSSTNGTHVKPDGEEEIFVNRGLVPLHGSGRIRLGEPTSVADAADIEYRVVYREESISA